MSDLMDDLAQLDSEWKDSKPEVGGFDSLPDGKVILRLNDAEICRSNTSGRIQVKYTWEVVEYLNGVKGEEAEQQVGRTQSSTQGLDNERGRGFFKRDLQRFDVKVPSSMQEIPDLLEQCVSREMECQVRNKDGWCNIYINGPARKNRGAKGNVQRSSGSGGQSRASSASITGDF